MRFLARRSFHDHTAVCREGGRGGPVLAYVARRRDRRSRRVAGGPVFQLVRLGAVEAWATSVGSQVLHRPKAQSPKPERLLRGHSRGHGKGAGGRESFVARTRGLITVTEEAGEGQQQAEAAAEAERRCREAAGERKRESESCRGTNGGALERPRRRKSGNAEGNESTRVELARVAGQGEGGRPASEERTRGLWRREGDAARRLPISLPKKLDRAVGRTAAARRPERGAAVWNPSRSLTRLLRTLPDVDNAGFQEHPHGQRCPRRRKVEPEKATGRCGRRPRPGRG